MSPFLLWLITHIHGYGNSMSKKIMYKYKLSISPNNSFTQ